MKSPGKTRYAGGSTALRRRAGLSLPGFFSSMANVPLHFSLA
jgi:hypothetical protein